MKVFPKATAEEKECFDLLRRAYVEARYNRAYKITREQLEYLDKRVQVLQELTEKHCRKKIESYTG